MKHGDLVIYHRNPMVVISVDGVFVLVDVLTFIDNFDSRKPVTEADFRLAIKRNHLDKFMLVDDRDNGASALFDALEGECDGFARFTGGAVNSHDLGKNIA